MTAEPHGRIDRRAWSVLVRSCATSMHVGGTRRGHKWCTLRADPMQIEHSQTLHGEPPNPSVLHRFPEYHLRESSSHRDKERFVTAIVWGATQ